MTDLIEKLQENAGLTTEQAAKALETIKDYVKEKFPMLAGAVDNIFQSTGGSTSGSKGFTDDDIL